MIMHIQENMKLNKLKVEQPYLKQKTFKISKENKNFKCAKHIYIYTNVSLMHFVIYTNVCKQYYKLIS